MASKHHVTSLVEDAIIKVSVYIIEDLEKGSIVIFGGRSLFFANLVDTNKEVVINRSSVVWEGSNNVLNAEDALSV